MTYQPEPLNTIPTGYINPLHRPLALRTDFNRVVLHRLERRKFVLTLDALVSIGGQKLSPRYFDLDRPCSPLPLTRENPRPESTDAQVRLAFCRSGQNGEESDFCKGRRGKSTSRTAFCQVHVCPTRLRGLCLHRQNDAGAGNPKRGGEKTPAPTANATRVTFRREYPPNARRVLLGEMKLSFNNTMPRLRRIRLLMTCLILIGSGCALTIHTAAAQNKPDAAGKDAKEKSADASDVAPLFVALDDLGELRVLNPLKFTADDLDKITAIIADSQAEYNRKLALNAAPALRQSVGHHPCGEEKSPRRNRAGLRRNHHESHDGLRGPPQRDRKRHAEIPVRKIAGGAERGASRGGGESRKRRIREDQRGRQQRHGRANFSISMCCASSWAIPASCRCSKRCEPPEESDTENGE